MDCGLDEGPEGRTVDNQGHEAARPNDGRDMDLVDNQEHMNAREDRGEGYAQRNGIDDHVQPSREEDRVGYGLEGVGERPERMNGRPARMKNKPSWHASYDFTFT